MYLYLHVIQGLEAVLDKAVHVEDGKKIIRYEYDIVPIDSCSTQYSSLSVDAETITLVSVKRA